MKETARHIGEAIASNPKTSMMVVAMTNLSNWWVEWGSPLVSFTTSILGLVLLIVLIRYHWENTKKLIRENK